MSQKSTKPYILRAIYEWCADNGFTPHLLVTVTERTSVPMEYVRDGQIVLNISAAACRDLVMDNDRVSFSARFGGVTRLIDLPMAAIAGIFARENGDGMMFPPEDDVDDEIVDDDDAPPPKGRPTLKVIK